MENFAPRSGSKARSVTPTARILIIAGSDSGGGAGIQADIKTVTMLGGHAMTAVTAVTAQNTVGVSAVHPVPAEMILAQIDAVIGDIGVDAVKIGMIGGAFAAEQVASRLERLKRRAAGTSDRLRSGDGGDQRRGARRRRDHRRLRPADGRRDDRDAQPARAQAPDVRRGPGRGRACTWSEPHGCAVLIKGGHEEGDALADALIEDDNMTSWQGQRIDTTSTHGTGCTLASAIALFLAEGATLADAVARAREFVRVALHDAPDLGQGAGPMGQARVRLDVGAGPRLNQVTVTGTNYERSVDFYRRIGLKQIVDSPETGYARFETAGGVDLLGADRPRREDPRDDRHLSRMRRPRRARRAAGAERHRRSSTARATSRGCGARRGCATPTATSSSSTRPARTAASRRGGWTSNPHISSSLLKRDPAGNENRFPLSRE